MAYFAVIGHAHAPVTPIICVCNGTVSLCWAQLHAFCPYVFAFGAYNSIYVKLKDNILFCNDVYIQEVQLKGALDNFNLITIF